MAVNGKLTSTFNNYLLDVVLAQIAEERSNSQLTSFDGVNLIGNHIGHYDLAVDWRIKKTNIMLYWQHPFEDASGVLFQNLPDGMYGLSCVEARILLPFLSGEGLFWNIYMRKTKPEMILRFQVAVLPVATITSIINSTLKAGRIKGNGLGTPFIPAKHEVKKGVPLNHL